MKILLGNNTLSWLKGSETWTLTLAIALKKLGHEVTCYGLKLGDISQAIEREGIRCFDNIALEKSRPDSAILQRSVGHEYDFIIANHWHIVEYLRSQFPKLPIISTIHGVIHYSDNEKTVPAAEHPSMNGGVGQFIAVSEEVQYVLKNVYNIDSIIVRNFFDLEKFNFSKVQKTPKQILINTNYANQNDPQVQVIFQVAKHYNARLGVVGDHFVSSRDVDKAIRESDIVVGMGRSVLEGVAMGRLGIVHGRWGTGGVIHEGSINELRPYNFSGRNSNGIYWTKEKFIEEIDKYYNEKTFQWGKEYIVANHNAETAAQLYVGMGKDLLGSNKKNSISVTPKNKPIIRGLMKMRNEADILQDTLDKWGEICNGGIYIYDDVSDDASVRIARDHKAVKDVIEGNFWDPDREKAEWFNRQAVLTRAQQDSGPNDWFVYFDADEHPYNFTLWNLFTNPDIKAIAMRLYDIYITPEDKDLPYHKRDFIGPEFRTIVFFFKNSPFIKYYVPDQREVALPPGTKVFVHGDIKHYGKGFSVDQWEATCDYYIRYWPKYSDKWRKRKGKAVKDDMLSDFGNKLLHWKDRDKGFSLENQSYGRN